jgi:hypothetical protein
MLRLRRTEEAERAFAHAIAVSELIGARSTLAAAALGAAELALACGNEGAAVQRLERAHAIAGEMRLGRYLPRIERLLHRAEPAAERV